MNRVFKFISLLLQCFSSFRLQTLTTLAVATIETQDTSLQDMLKFKVDGTIDKMYVLELNNSSSKVYQELKKELFEKIDHQLADMEFLDVDLRQFLNNSYVGFSAWLYFERNTTTNEAKIKSSMGSDVFFMKVLVSEICADSTCGENGQCNKTSTCVCKHGFKGKRCEIKYAINGTTYGSWSVWTSCSKTCGGGIRRRFRFCSPIPVHGGICVMNPGTIITNETCNFQLCRTEHSDDDYYIVTYICGGIFLMIVVLLIFFRCVQQYKKSTLINDAIGHKGHERMTMNAGLDTYSNKSSKSSYSTHLPYVRGKDNFIPLHTIQSEYRDSVSTNQIQFNPLHECIVEKDSPTDSGFDNMAYRGQEEDLSESEEIYRDQIEKFLRRAPELRHNVVIPRTPPSGRTKFVNSPKEYTPYSHIATSSPLPNPHSAKNGKQLQTTQNHSKPNERPNLHVTSLDVESKLVNRGPVNYQLVLV